MRCPKCSSPDLKVIETRPGKSLFAIRRRRQCLNCQHRFTTIEEILQDDVYVIKRDGRREEFDPSKLTRGLRKALEKRPVSMEKIEELVHQIKLALQSKYDSEVPSNAIGEEIIERLKDLDQIAYVRFASVYKDFHDLSQIVQEISTLNSN